MTIRKQCDGDQEPCDNLAYERQRFTRIRRQNQWLLEENGSLQEHNESLAAETEELRVLVTSMAPSAVAHDIAQMELAQLEMGRRFVIVPDDWLNPPEGEHVLKMPRKTWEHVMTVMGERRLRQPMTRYLRS